MAMGKLDPITHGFFRDYDEFEDAIADGWTPPYSRGAAERSTPEPEFFARTALVGACAARPIPANRTAISGNNAAMSPVTRKAAGCIPSG